MDIQEHDRLSSLNTKRLTPAVPIGSWQDELALELEARERELRFVEEERAHIEARAAEAPTDPEAFVAWFEALEQDGPGQNDPLFPWLAEVADVAQVRWFLTQEVAGEAGFEDLVALTQVKMPVRPKLELARNYWDEMGRGKEGGMHGPMLARLAEMAGIATSTAPIVPEARALGNLMVALATHRRYAFHSIGALGVIELTAPWRAAHVNRALERLGFQGEARRYYALHATLDVRHSEAWNREVLAPLVAGSRMTARFIAEGALLRLTAGARCFARYREELGLETAGRALAG